MRRLFLSVLTAVLVASFAAPAMAHPTSALGPTLPTDATFGATDNIEYFGRYPEHASTAGGRQVGNRYFVTDGRGVSVYDVQGYKATRPELLGQLPLMQVGTGLALSQEDVDTDGHVLIVDGAPSGSTASDFRVVDVEDPANMSVIGTVDVTDHTWTCVSGMIDTGEIRGCAYVFGRSGPIIDLTDPAAPVRLPFTWRQIVNYGSTSNSPYAHDLTEVKPGLVMTAGSSMILMDTTALLQPGHDPSALREITRVTKDIHGHQFSSLGYHSMEWAVDADGRLNDHFVAGTEIAPSGATNLAGSDCQGEEAVVESFDASAVAQAYAEWEAGTIDFAALKARSSITLVEAFDAAGRGAYVDGKSPAHVLYCAHWMELSPDFNADGGWVAISYYDRGTRLVKMLPDGTFDEEGGWMVPVQGYSGSVQWVTNDVLYVHDYTRGLEILGFSGAHATGMYESGTSVTSVMSNFTPPSRFHAENVPFAIALLMGFGLLVLDIQRRRAHANR